MENAVVETAVQTVEAVEEPAKQAVKTFPKGKTGLIVLGTAGAVVGGYFLVTKVIVPAAKKHRPKKCEPCVENEAPEQVETKEEAPKKETKAKK